VCTHSRTWLSPREMVWGDLSALYAWQALRERGALAVDARLDARSGRRVIVTGV